MNYNHNCKHNYWSFSKSLKFFSRFESLEQFNNSAMLRLLLTCIKAVIFFYLNISETIPETISDQIFYAHILLRIQMYRRQVPSLDKMKLNGKEKHAFRCKQLTEQFISSHAQIRLAAFLFILPANAMLLIVYSLSDILFFFFKYHLAIPNWHYMLRI